MICFPADPFQCGATEGRRQFDIENETVFEAATIFHSYRQDFHTLAK